MHPRHFLLTALFTILARACAPLNARQKGQDFPIAQSGPDIPPSPFTAGYFINHVALNTHNLTRSVAWYRDALGFQVLFTYRASPRYSVVYLAHSTQTENETYQTAAELTEAMMSGRVRGLLELVYFDRTDSDGADEALMKLTRPTRFSHLGLIVPDVVQAQDRFESLGVKVIKGVGELPDFEGPAGAAFGLLGQVFENDPKEAELISRALLDVLLVLDPDGNLVEVQSLFGGMDIPLYEVIL
ncbi:Glyoxalase/Bleomycin resistance protein/Dihydroxybiphenyl dioxygenase [Cladorrhinum sp. PSN259]|nr:Glyoxalase/Bleomycin resistance protein/Dihydroxybiphenyl dioxygenase [Cladorrhinum sp. PSN259]